MTRLASLKTHQVVGALETLGFERVRQKGSHALFHHPDCRRAPVPIHPSQGISPYLLADILKEMRLGEAVFLEAAHRASRPVL